MRNLRSNKTFQIAIDDDVGTFFGIGGDREEEMLDFTSVRNEALVTKSLQQIYENDVLHGVNEEGIKRLFLLPVFGSLSLNTFSIFRVLEGKSTMDMRQSNW